MLFSAWEVIVNAAAYITLKRGPHPPNDIPVETYIHLYDIEADTWEDACTEHHRRQGWKPLQGMEE